MCAVRQKRGVCAAPCLGRHSLEVALSRFHSFSNAISEPQRRHLKKITLPVSLVYPCLLCIEGGVRCLAQSPKAISRGFKVSNEARL